MTTETPQPNSPSSSPSPAGEPPRRPDSALSRWHRWRRSRAGRFSLYALATLVVLVAAFGLLGYYWLPGYAKAQLEAQLSAQLQRPVTVARIEVEPFALRAAVDGLEVKDRDGRRLAGFQRLALDISSESLFRLIPVISAVSLEKPYVYLSRVAPGHYNISDLIQAWLARPAGPTPEFSVANIEISDGQVDFDDRPMGESHRLTDVDLSIPFIANTPSATNIDVEPRFSAKLNGAPLVLSGKLRPFGPEQVARLEFRVLDLDLSRLDDYVPVPLPFQLKKAWADTRLAVDFARPTGKKPSISLAGDVSLRDVSLLRPGSGVVLTLAKGEAHFRDLHLEQQRLDKGGLELDDLALRRNGEKAPFASFHQLAVQDVAVDWGHQRARVGEVDWDGPKLSLKRRADGNLDLAALLKEGPQAPAKGSRGARSPARPGASAPSRGSVPAPQARSKAWVWQVDKVRVSGGRADYADLGLDKVPPLKVADLSLKVDGLASSGKAVPLSLQAKVNDRGRLALTGQGGWAPPTARLKLDMERVNLVALQGWVADRLNVVLTRGEVSVQGQLDYQAGRARFTGATELADFNVLDRLNATDLLRWKRLALAEVTADTGPEGVRIGQVTAQDFYARIILNKDGRLNLRDALKSPGEAQKDLTTAPALEHPGRAAPAPVQAKAPTPAPASGGGAGLPLRIGKVVFSGGHVNFSDRYVKPNYNANLTDLTGSLGTLAAGNRTPVSLRGRVDRSAPMEMSGQVDPLGKDLFLDLKGKARGIEMAGFTPYSGRYLGYTIDKGKLSMDVAYHVEKGSLQASNHIFLDQLTLGDKVESPDAISGPIKLVVALLKNSRGEIDLNLPIQGSINDPQFSVGGIVLKMIGNLIVKAATAPFSLISSLFSDGADLSYLPFDPGRSRITPAMEKQLGNLAKALRDRPSLDLEITGHADPAKDADGLKQALLERKLKAAKAADLAKAGKDGGSLADITLSPEEYNHYLEKAYKAADFKKPRNLIGLTKSLPPAEMERLLLANATLEEDDLKQLAQRRGAAVQAWLLDKGAIPPDRVFLLTPKVGLDAPQGAPEGGRADFALK